MAMSHKGLTKLLEECGELSQIAAKKIAFEHTDEHPDGDLPMSVRLENEIGDVFAAIFIVTEQLGLNHDLIISRAESKKELFERWIADPTCK